MTEEEHRKGTAQMVGTVSEAILTQCRREVDEVRTDAKRGVQWDAGSDDSPRSSTANSHVSDTKVIEVLDEEKSAGALSSGQPKWRSRRPTFSGKEEPDEGRGERGRRLEDRPPRKEKAKLPYPIGGKRESGGTAASGGTA